MGLLTNVTVGRKIGEGEFSYVYEGVWNGTTPVALKKLKDQSKFTLFQGEVVMLRCFSGLLLMTLVEH